MDNAAAIFYDMCVMAKKKRRKMKLVPRLGPPTNLRPAGAHENLAAYNRRRQKADLREELGEVKYDFDAD